MAKTNFQIFNEENALERTYNDSEYKEATQRIGGVMPGMALSRMHNKMYYQWSSMCKALANLIVNHGHDCMDNDVEGITRNLNEAILSAATNASLNLLQRNHAYAVGDIAYSRSLPSWARLECVKAGTTADTEPAFASITKAGQLITDGGVTWIVDDVRDGARVGDIILRPTLREGYIKANGATVKASEYPRLLVWVQESNMIVTAEQYVQDCSKYVYDEVQDKLTLPNMTGRVLQGGEAVKSVEAGLPNITGVIPIDTGAYGASVCDFVGAIYDTDEGMQYKHLYSNSGYGKTNHRIMRMDSSKANPIYGSSDTVQPPALNMIAQIKY